MAQTITLQYQLTGNDYIEAEQLRLIKSKSAWLNLIYSLVFLIYGFVDLKRVSYQDFLIFSYLKEFFVSEEIPTNSLASALFYFSFALLISFSTFPKYNPLYRWRLFKKHRKNFVKQEIKNIMVDEIKISIKSESYRKSM